MKQFVRGFYEREFGFILIYNTATKTFQTNFNFGEIKNRNAWKVLKRGAGEGWRRSVGPIM